MRADGTVVVWGKAANGVTAVPSALRNVASIAVGEDYELAVVGTGPPRFGPQLASVVAPAGAAAVLAANVEGPYPLTLQWYHDGTAVAGATNRCLFLGVCQIADGGDYVLVATNAFGQVSSQPVNLAVQPDLITISSVGAWGDDSEWSMRLFHTQLSVREPSPPGRSTRWR